MIERAAPTKVREIGVQLQKAESVQPLLALAARLNDASRVPVPSRPPVDLHGIRERGGRRVEKADGAEETGAVHGVQGRIDIGREHHAHGTGALVKYAPFTPVPKPPLTRPSAPPVKPTPGLL